MKLESTDTARFEMAKIVLEYTENKADGLVLACMFLADLMMSIVDNNKDEALKMLNVSVLPTLYKSIEKRAQMLKDGTAIRITVGKKS